MWMKTTRSRVGRKDESRSGQGAVKRLTETEVKLRTRFGFLREHIFRQPSRPSSNVSCNKLHFVL